MVLHDQAPLLYIPFLLLSVIATVIASQAMISGMFSIVYQGITTRIMPMFKVEYTSYERQSQIYIGSVNWFLLLAGALHHGRLQGVEGTGGGLRPRGDRHHDDHRHHDDLDLPALSQTGRMAVAALVTVVDLAYLLSNTYKIPHGGYWSLIIAAIPLSVIIVYRDGQKKLYRELRPLPLDVFLLSYKQIYRSLSKISGTALFFAKDAKAIPPYIVHTMFKNNIIYEDNIIVSIVRRVDPYGVTGFFRNPLEACEEAVCPSTLAAAPGLRFFEIQVGYMEVVDVEEVLKEAGIVEKVIFYGVEEIQTRNPFWHAFSFIKKNTPTIVRFYDLPPNKLHGVVTRVEL